MSGKINVLEYEDRLVFKNEGTFIPETIEAALESGYKPPTAAWQSAREWGSACRSRRRAQSQPRARLHVPLAFAFLAWSSFRHRDLN